MKKSTLRVLFILSRILGGRTFSNQVITTVKDFEYIDPQYIFFDNEDYAQKHLSIISHLTHRFIESSLVRNKYDEMKNKNVLNDYDVLFIQGFELILGFREIIKKIPTILAHDSTNISSYRLILNQEYSRKAVLTYFAKYLLTYPIYKGIVHDIDVFIPRTQWCANSLVHDYHVKPSKIIVSPGGIDLDKWKPEPFGNAKPKLLFVGNDFIRKGGPFLLDLFSSHLQKHADLIIVSNDIYLKDYRLPQGVKLYQGETHNNIEKIIDLYKSCDLFLYPTKKDQLGLVLLEACAMGLPIIASDVGGVSEIVNNGYNGFLMPYHSNCDEWRDKVMDLIIDRQKYDMFSRNARRMAQEKFSLEVFKSNLNKVLSRFI